MTPTGFSLAHVASHAVHAVYFRPYLYLDLLYIRRLVEWLIVPAKGLHPCANHFTSLTSKLGLLIFNYSLVRMSSMKYELPSPSSPHELFVLQVGSETCLATSIVNKTSQVNPLGTMGERRPEPLGIWGVSCLTFHQVSLHSPT